MDQQFTQMPDALPWADRSWILSPSVELNFNKTGNIFSLFVRIWIDRIFELFTLILEKIISYSK